MQICLRSSSQEPVRLANLSRRAGFTEADMPLLVKESILLGNSAGGGARQSAFSPEGEAPAEPRKGSPGGSPSQKKSHGFGALHKHRTTKHIHTGLPCLELTR